MKKFICFILAIVLVFAMTSAAFADNGNDNGKPVYIAVYGLNQLNRDCIWAVSSSGYVDSIQIWDGGTCIKNGWLQPNHEYTVKIQVKGTNVALDGRKGQVYINGQYAWGGHGINSTDEAQSWVTAKTTFKTPAFYGFPCCPWYMQMYGLSSKIYDFRVK